ncbi:hypothetical protein GCM10010339_05860 [Streptomyces alanosinicus]|uniref:Uncharacterized protein n=1 Tax=Streptomyces alanosinicus TaxID=68171 RepID=A0A918YCK1_9ACTN|nr:hypothetical protein GCM10010339_05860 [Streptomyces alanosinicus]
MQEFAAHCLVPALDRVLGTAEGGLEGDAAVGERRADLYDDAVAARQHPAQGCLRAVQSSAATSSPFRPRATSATWSPRAAKARAAARPTPPLAPVTTTTRGPYDL